MTQHCPHCGRAFETPDDLVFHLKADDPCNAKEVSNG